MDNELIKINENKDLISHLYEYVKECLGFDKDVKISFLLNKVNAENPLGRTAYYSPEECKIYVYITGRHIKDIMRSMAHEMVHHAQNCDGQLQNIETPEGYAQTNEHLRQMEEDAYLRGNMMFRDWTDKIMSEKDVVNDTE